MDMDADWVRSIVTVAIATMALLIWLIRWFGKHDEWRKGMDEFKKDTKVALAEIRDDVKDILGRLPPSVIVGSSPLQLTALGKKVSEAVGAVAWANREASQLVDKVKGKNPYEVQEICVDYMRNKYQLTTEEDQSFKQCAYEHGIKLEQVLDVCAVKLRDKLLHMDSEGTEP